MTNGIFLVFKIAAIRLTIYSKSLTLACSPAVKSVGYLKIPLYIVCYKFGQQH